MSDASSAFFSANWPAPARVHTLISTRALKSSSVSGSSQPPYDRLNLGDHVGDDVAAVSQNRHLFTETGGFQACQWLQQVHGLDVVEAQRTGLVQADGTYTSQTSLACVVLTADCLPVLLCNTEGTQVAAVHAGWRGLASGILASALQKFSRTDQVMAYLGPAISRKYFEIDQPVVTAFSELFGGLADREWEACFIPLREKPGHYWCDLYGLARCHLQNLGVTGVYGGEYCTFEQEDLFYSFRRDGLTGRQATAIWLD